VPLTPDAADAVAKQIVSALKVPKEGVAAATANWSAVVAAIFAGITQNALVVPTALAAPSGGGPVMGTGAVT
jgi:hypothetical protein